MMGMLQVSSRSPKSLQDNDHSATRWLIPDIVEHLTRWMCRISAGTLECASDEPVVTR
ncbi:hypothetical protein QF000_000737 [Paraburkholderia atlantica]|uniref:Uncharacterized protein n=2 Tax=Paraburkholderia TaxID=1822464 RepID=A0A7W8LH74_9BURK|nr:hypothetical protein [Paraburkholderia youngii]MBB5429357.1 hypothetical protein [Paraburkholderia atlantica]